MLDSSISSKLLSKNNPGCQIKEILDNKAFE